MKKLYIGILLTIMMTSLFAACAKKSENRTTVENTKEAENGELEKEGIEEKTFEPETGFPGFVLGDLETGVEDTIKEEFEQGAQNGDGTMEDSISNITKEEAVIDSEEKEDSNSTKENIYDEDLLEPPKESSAIVI